MILILFYKRQLFGRKQCLNLLQRRPVIRPNLIMFLPVAERAVLYRLLLVKFRHKYRPDPVLLTLTQLQLGGHHRKLMSYIRGYGGGTCRG